MNSMTGFGRGEAEMAGYCFTVEVKSVNHRYLEPTIRLSRKMAALESPIRGLLKQRLGRGKVDMLIMYENHNEAQGEVKVKQAKLEAYVRALREQAERFGLTDDLALSHILQLPDVLTSEETQEDFTALEPALMEAVGEALDQLCAMRAREGDALKRDLTEKLEELGVLVEEITQRAPLVVKEYKEKLYARIAEHVSAGVDVEPGRLETEITIFADRCCIDEELTRLKSHIRQYRQMLEKNEPVGRQLDFLTQELNREANTIASKANDLTVTKQALALKNVIEKMREQIQNIE